MQNKGRDQERRARAKWAVGGRLLGIAVGLLLGLPEVWGIPGALEGRVWRSQQADGAWLAAPPPAPNNVGSGLEGVPTALPASPALPAARQSALERKGRALGTSGTGAGTGRWKPGEWTAVRGPRARSRLPLAPPHARVASCRPPRSPTHARADTLETRGRHRGCSRVAPRWGRGPFIRFRRRKTFSARRPPAPAPRRWPAGRR